MNILHSAPCWRDVDTTTGVPLYQIVVKQLGLTRSSLAITGSVLYHRLDTYDLYVRACRTH